MKRLFALAVSLMILVCSSYVFALPSNPAVEDNKLEAGHAGLTKLSADIKRRLPESKSNGLNAVLGGNDENAADSFKKLLSTANVAEDYKPNTRWHFYDPDTKQGFLGVFQNAKDRAKDWYTGDGVFALLYFEKFMAGSGFAYRHGFQSNNCQRPVCYGHPFRRALRNGEFNIPQSIS